VLLLQGDSLGQLREEKGVEIIIIAGRRGGEEGFLSILMRISSSGVEGEGISDINTRKGGGRKHSISSMERR